MDVTFSIHNEDAIKALRFVRDLDDKSIHFYSDAFPYPCKVGCEQAQQFLVRDLLKDMNIRIIGQTPAENDLL